MLPRNSRSGPFSKGGDSGSIVVNGTGQVAGLLTGGAGVTDISDCTYLDPIPPQALGGARYQTQHLPHQ